MKTLAGLAIIGTLLFPTVGKVYEGTIGSIGSGSSVSKSIFPKSDVPKSVNGVNVVGAFEKGGLEQAIGAK